MTMEACADTQQSGETGVKQESEIGLSQVITLYHHLYLKMSSLLLRITCATGWFVLVVGLHNVEPGVIQQSHSGLGAAAQRPNRPSARGDPSGPALGYPAPSGPSSSGLQPIPAAYFTKTQ